MLRRLSAFQPLAADLTRSSSPFGPSFMDPSLIGVRLRVRLSFEKGRGV